MLESYHDKKLFNRIHGFKFSIKSYTMCWLSKFHSHALMLLLLGTVHILLRSVVR